MKKIFQRLMFPAFLLACLSLRSQNLSPNCATISDQNYLTGEVFFNYGSGTNLFNAANRTSATVGQAFVGTSFGQQHVGGFGFWTRFLLPPNAPVVTASEGDLEDRIQVDWRPDPLSPAATGGFNVYRNGALLAHVDPETRAFVDFNVLAGKFYTYSVAGVNDFGEGYKGSALGFLNPNGVVTGQVKTASGNPVPGALVSLAPTLGTAISLGSGASLFSPHHPALSPSQFTVSCWVKIGDGNDSSGILDLGSAIQKNWWLHTTGAGTKGVSFALGNGSGSAAVSHEFPAASAGDWHFVAATFNGMSLLLYVDGELVGATPGSMAVDSSIFFLGRRSPSGVGGGGGGGFFTGKLDEVRIFSRQLSQTELQMFMNRTVPANADGLELYWKFDEGVGTKGFDQSANKFKAYLCGAAWTTDKPNVVNAGVTDLSGFYEIAGVNYGGGTTFTATAAKRFYLNQSLEFNAVNSTYADLTDFDLVDSSTVTLTVKAFDFAGNQTLLSKSDGMGNVFTLALNSGNLELTTGGSTHVFGALGMGFHHLALTLAQSGGSLAATLFVDGTQVGNHVFSGVPEDWSGSPWKLGAKADGAGHAAWFTGLIDEAAFFSQALQLSEIQAFANAGTSPEHLHLTHYFNLNEGIGTAQDEYTQGLIGAYVGGVGASVGTNLAVNFTKTESETNTDFQSVTAGFVLTDDDPGDNFSVNVLQDEMYGTPVFKTVAGQSSCPHEPKTQPREQVALSVDRNVAVNVLANDAAVFKFTLGNLSQSGDAREYLFSAIPESNPDGAVIKVNGMPLFDVPFGLPFAEGQEVTVTVERGALAFDYEGLEIALFSACEDERAVALGIDPAEYFYASEKIDVHFLEPCSEVDVIFPLQDWVLTPASGEILFVTLGQYDVGDPDLELVRVQYRRSQGDGAWINIAEIEKADLGSVFEVVEWNTANLQDGFYEIRAISQCYGGQDAGISHVMKGKIERQPPEIFGSPEPADGVLSPNDEISITFTEPIRCDKIIQADFFSNNNAGLYNTRTGDLVDAVVTCSGDKITIVPNVPNQFIENEILRVEIDSVEDLAGNKFGHVDWAFFVDRNSLRWLGADIEEMVVEGNALTVYREMENVSGATVNYVISSLPGWVGVLPSEGSLPPGGTQVITFKFPADLPRGDYLDSIFLETPLGDEPLTLDLRVLCEAPAWSVDPSAWDFTMNFTVELDIEGTVSEDEMDLVGAFVGNELRGVAHVQYEPAVEKWLAFLTVYSDQAAGETVTFQIWDADACLRYGDILEEFPFALDGLTGSPLAPQTLHTNGLLLRNIAVHPGWNWLSFNLNVPDKSTGNVLGSLAHPENGLVKSQTQFSQFHSGSGSWLGTLATMGYKSAYQLNASQHDTIRLVGLKLEADTVAIPINTGWNWLPYLPNEALSPDEALASLTPLNGDILKSQTAFAQYVAGSGWIGNLDFLSSPNGYLLRIGNPGVLTFPAGFAGGGGGSEATYRIPSRYPIRERGLGLWSVDPSQFEHSMNLIALVAPTAAGENLLETGDVVGAFSGDEVRGGNEAIWVEPMQKWLVFLTVYANGAGEEISFKYYDSSAEDIHRLSEKLSFTIDNLTGSVETPQVLTLLESTGTEEVAGGGWLEIYPNPASEHVFAAFGSAGGETAVVRISDSFGRQVERLEVETVGGLNVVKWDAGNVKNGTYFITLTAGGQTFTRRFSVLN